VAKNQTTEDEPSFEQSLAELERIVDELEAGNLGLGDALEAYEVGIKHLKLCHKLLETAERRIELLSGVDAAGNAIAAPFDEHFSEDLAERASSRSRKRTATHNSSPHELEPCDGAAVDDPRSLF
jgi:exodeoxyribonuclease VII small subunit